MPKRRVDRSPAWWQHPWIKFGLFFLIASSLSYLLEHIWEKFATDHEEHSEIATSLFDAGVVYQRLVSAWPRHLVPRYVAVVNIDYTRDPLSSSLHNICEQRNFMADLVAAIAERGAALIVLDKYFLAHGCNKPASTERLRESVAAVSKRVPVVVGAFIEHTEPQFDSYGNDVWETEKTVEFEGGGIGEGLINVERDKRRLPLGWPVFTTHPAGEWRHGLALEAAQRYDALLFEKYPVLSTIAYSHSNPYVSLIPRSQFAEFRAGEVLCAWSGLVEKPAQCKDLVAPKVQPEYLRGRVVVVGETHKMDEHATAIGRMPGFILQANYIEAILDDRYYKPVPWWIDYAIGFLFFLAIEAALRQQSALRGIASLVGVVAMMLVLLSLTVRYLGYYLNPVTVSVFILGIKLIAWLTERIARKGEEHEA
jgi:CHASE2 domain-containing sensor protein